MIIFLDSNSKLRTPEDVDTLLSAEFPDEEEEAELLELVKKHMVHTPCGPNNPTAPYMKDGKCSKGFPKPFREETTIHMPISEDVTLERHMRLEVIKSTIDGLFPIHASGSGGFVVISTWSASSQSRPSSTFTNMSTKVMIAPLWSSDNARTRSSYIWTPVMFPPVKEFGG